MNASTFQQTIFPGLSNEAKMHAPKSLHEFLNNDTYEEEMASRGIPDARKKAEEVLISVKKKGAAAGQFMDPQTEASLWPQIMQEAIAHQVVNVVNRVHKRAHSSLGINAAVLTAVCCALDLNDSNVLAEPIALPDQMLEMARNILPQSTNLGGKDDNSDDSEDDSVVEQLPFEAIEGLLVVPNLPAPRMKELCSHSPSSGLSTGSGYVVVDDLIGDFDFFGPSIRRDCERLLQTDRLSTIPVLQKPRGGSSNSNDGDKGDDGGDSNVEDGSLLGAGYGKIAWVDGKELENNYASVSEVIRNLRNLLRKIRKMTRKPKRRKKRKKPRKKRKRIRRMKRRRRRPRRPSRRSKVLLRKLLPRPMPLLVETRRMPPPEIRKLKVISQRKVIRKPKVTSQRKVRHQRKERSQRKRLKSDNNLL